MLSCADYSLSAILRMLTQLDRGEKTDLRRALDTPRPAWRETLPLHTRVIELNYEVGAYSVSYLCTLEVR